MLKNFCKPTKMPQAKFPSSKYFLMFSVRLIKASAVKCFGLQPNCKG